MSNARKTEAAEAIARLREWLKPGDTLYSILRHVSRSGMQRSIALVRLGPDEWHPGQIAIRQATTNAAKALELPFDREREGIKVNGCGMDMGSHLTYELGRVLWPDGFGCIGENCPSNDHSNGDRDYTPHGGTADGPQCKNELPCYCHGEVAPWPGWTCSNCGCHTVEHWHRDGGYALRSRWL